MNAAIYIRVSTAAQAGEEHMSLEVQEAECRAYASRKHWNIVATEVDHESGSRVTRQGYNRVLNLARNGFIDAVIVFRADRFGRDAGEVLVRAKEIRPVELHSTREDLTSFLMLGITAVFAEDEIRRMLERTMPAKRRKAEAGYWLAHAPMGTVNDKGILREGPRFDLVRMAFEMAADGENVAEITRRVSDTIAPEYITYARMLKVLRNPAYIGVVRWGGVEAKAQWNPLIDPELWRLANAQLAKRYVQRKQLTRSYPYWVLGLAYCTRCGARMHPKVHVSKWGTYPYLVCGRADNRQLKRPCVSREYVKIPHLQDWLLEQLEVLRVSATTIDALVEKLTGHHDTRMDDWRERRETIEAERSRLERRLQSAKAAHLDAPETFTLSDVKSISAAVAERMKVIARELAEPQPAPDIDVAAVRQFFEDGRWLEKAESDPQVFRAFLQQFIERVDVGEPGKYSIVWRPAFAGVTAPFT